MESRFHIVASVVVGLSVFGATGSVVGLVSAVLIGVLIDVDHVVLACYRHRTLAPIGLVVRKGIQGSLPEVFDVYPIYGVNVILIVHSFVGGLVTFGGFFVNSVVGSAVGVSVILHIGMDVYSSYF